MHIAIVTLHYQNLEDTLSLLASLAKVDIPKDTTVSIYVVDNEGSTSLSKGIKMFPNIKLITSGANLGFAAGNNLGFKKAIEDGNEILVAINNDTFVGRDFVKQILASSITDKNVGVVGGLIYFAPGYEFKKGYQKNELGKVIWYAGGKFDRDNVLGSNDHVDEVDSGQLNQSADTDFITGALLITREDVIKKVGVFDEKYFMYLEDVDLCHRIKRAGYRIVFDPRIKMWHKVAQGSAIGSTLNDYFITRNRLYFGLKYARFRTKFALLREAFRKLITGTPAQKHAIRDFFLGKLEKGTYLIDK